MKKIHLGRLFLVAACSVLAPVSAAELGPIRFNEHPVNTYIYDQYVNYGILFSGDSPYITTDGANPTSPVLSGTPRFFGRITGTFVDPLNPEMIKPVSGFRFTGGYFDSIGSVRIEWFDKSGNKLGQRSNSQFSIENFSIADSGPIAAWTIGIFADEPAGYGIDNIYIEPLGPSIIFRELKEGGKLGNFWYPLGKDIPGYDHVGFQMDDVVYESHPGYPAGLYRTGDGSNPVEITEIDGVQNQHSAGTFKHDSTSKKTKVIEVEELPVSEDLAAEMRSYIQARRAEGATFRFLDFSTLDQIDATMSPFVQKGGTDNRFTCVGLVEAAAEHAGHNEGEGFIRDAYESILVDGKQFPLLSPQLLNFTMKTGATVNAAKQWFQGFFDPVDFIITDPVGRRLGHAPGIGSIREIPGAFYSGDGTYEQVLIPNPLPGNYSIELFGKNLPLRVAFSDYTDSQSSELEKLRKGSSQKVVQAVLPRSGVRGDLNNDGFVNSTDLNLLKLQPKSYSNSSNDPRDINNDGIISTSDVIALERLLSPPDASASPFAGVITQLAGKFSTKPPGKKKVSGADLFYFNFGSEIWAATDNLGNESIGTWEAMNKKGTIVRLTYNNTNALMAQVRQALESAYLEYGFDLDFPKPPTLTIVKNAKGRYKAVLKAGYIVTLDGGKPRKGTYRSMLQL